MRCSCRPIVFACLGGFAAFPGAARSDGLRDFCPDRPGLNTPACVVDRGHVVIETSFVDWSYDRNSDERSNTTGFGATLVRYGLTDTLEVRAAFDGYAFASTRDRATSTTTNDDGAGDISFSLRQNLRNPDGSGFAVAVMPYVTLPTGTDSISAGDWAAGVLMPLSLELTKGVSLAVTPEVDAAVDSDGDGRHLAFGSAIGLGFTVTDSLSIAMEAQFIRDEDPEGDSTQAVEGLALGWKARDSLQFDVGVARGLNADTADWQISTGVAHRF